MDAKSIAEAVQRVEQAFARKPGLARHDDLPALATLAEGLRVRVELPGGAALYTDLPPQMGGEGAGVPPGWLMRAGLASCLTTAVALRAACLGIELRALSVRALSESDARGLLDVEPAVAAGPLGLTLNVALEAVGADEATLRELVAWADAHSPLSDAVRRAIDLRVRFEAQAA
ncbi:OsmC family protein [uncultured Piscinibacter sp.]|uniref:OsmC family protein n=1 Tax=uncultured Piscinibacter sp. TaxID=1131835 RepID=UPI00261E3F4A|nr:OsmC family protein [uncultured Piscinibacter sp.]